MIHRTIPKSQPRDVSALGAQCRRAVLSTRLALQLCDRAGGNLEGVRAELEQLAELGASCRRLLEPKPVEVQS
jgi:hypothetical protein